MIQRGRLHAPQTLPANEQWVVELLRERDLGQTGVTLIPSMRHGVLFFFGLGMFLVPPAMSGELGPATDFPSAKVRKFFGSEMNGRCGKVETKCTINFNNERMSVNGSSGITRDQIVMVDFIEDAPHVHLVYTDYMGIKRLAVFRFSRTAAFDLVHTILFFWSGGQFSGELSHP